LAKEKVKAYDDENDVATIQFCGVTITKRTAGIIGAVVNGMMTGTSFIPIPYAKKIGFGGNHYMISYAVGALLSNAVLWFLCVGYTFFYYSCTSPPNSRQSMMNLLSAYYNDDDDVLHDISGGMPPAQPCKKNIFSVATVVSLFGAHHPSSQQQHTSRISLPTRIRNTYRHLPKLYFKQLWFPGFMAGT
jgi:hypothetical protein